MTPQNFSPTSGRALKKVIFYLVFRNSLGISRGKNYAFANLPTSFCQIFLKLIKTVFTSKNYFLTTTPVKKKFSRPHFFWKSNIFFCWFLHFFAHFFAKMQKVPKQPKWPFLTFFWNFFIFTKNSKISKNSNFWFFWVSTRPSAGYLESLKYDSGHFLTSEDSFYIFRAIRNSMAEDWDSQIVNFLVLRHL